MKNQLLETSLIYFELFEKCVLPSVLPNEIVSVLKLNFLLPSVTDWTCELVAASEVLDNCFVALFCKLFACGSI